METYVLLTHHKEVNMSLEVNLMVWTQPYNSLQLVPLSVISQENISLVEMLFIIRRVASVSNLDLNR